MKTALGVYSARYTDEMAERTQIECCRQRLAAIAPAALLVGARVHSNAAGVGAPLAYGTEKGSRIG